jgi:hypothetical protein
MSEKIFTENDYKSNGGMITYIWGPPLWHTLHIMSFNYPINPTIEQKNDYLIYFLSLKNVLPCKYCRENYDKNLKILPITRKVLKNRENFSKWLFDLHELVNTNLGKKSGLTYEEVRDTYEQFRSRCLIEKKPKKEDLIIEKGCTESLYGIKSKCILNIVPREKKCNSIIIDKKSQIKKI